MLLLPYQSRFSVRALPVVTLALVVLGILVQLWVQRDDADVRRAALQAYARSSLPNIESPRYEAWLRARRDDDARARLRALEQDRATRRVDEIGGLTPSLSARLSTSDPAFTRDVRAGRIVTPADPDYVRWKADRDAFDAAVARSPIERFGLTDVRHLLQWVTHAFIHPDIGHLVANLLVLLLAGPFAEAALGRLRFVAGLVLAVAGAGLFELALTGGPVLGLSGAASATVAMVAVLYRLREAPVFYGAGFVFGTARLPTLALVPVWLLSELYQWSTGQPGLLAQTADIAGLAIGAGVAALVRPDPVDADDALLGESFGDGATREGSLLADARAAARRADYRRATRLYRELLTQTPQQTDLVLAFFAVTMLGRDDDALRDACIRLLRVKGRNSREELRQAFLQMSQPKVLAALAVDDQLRLARRLVRVREDSAALRVLDRLLLDDRDVQAHGRQIGDCMLALYITYSRNGLRTQAKDVQARMVRTFGGRPDLVAPRPPGTAQLRRALDETNTLNVPTR